MNFAKFQRTPDDCFCVHDQSYKSSFHEKLELIQYNAALAVTVAVRGSSFEKLYQKLDLESLKNR